MTASIVTLGGERCRILPQAPFGLLIEPARSAQPVQSLAIEALRELARRHGVLILRGFESGFTDPERLTRYGEGWGEIMMWPFGAVLDVKEHENATDHIFDSSYVPLHWDGMYKPTLPEFQLFHCVHAPAADEGAHHLHQYPPIAQRARRRAAGPLGAGAHHLSHQAGGALRRPGALAAAGAPPGERRDGAALQRAAARGSAFSQSACPRD